MSCKNNLKQLGLALHIYESTYRVLPPGYLHTFGNDMANQMGFAWGTMILPQVEHSEVYEDFDFNVPVFAPVNLQPREHPAGRCFCARPMPFHGAALSSVTNLRIRERSTPVRATPRTGDRRTLRSIWTTLPDGVRECFTVTVQHAFETSWTGSQTHWPSANERTGRSLLWTPRLADTAYSKLPGPLRCARSPIRRTTTGTWFCSRLSSAPIRSVETTKAYRHRIRASASSRCVMDRCEPSALRSTPISTMRLGHARAENQLANTRTVANRSFNDLL